MDKGKSFFNKIEVYLIILIFSFMVIVSGFTVFSRYLFSFTFSWAEQSTRLGFVWITFAAVSYAGLYNHHMRVNLLSKYFGNYGKHLLLLGDIITIIFAFYMSYKISNIMMTSIRRGQMFSGMPWMPIWVMYLAGVLGTFGLGVRTIQRNIIEYKNARSADSSQKTQEDK